MFVVRREVFAALLDDKEWSDRLEQARTAANVERVVAEFVRAKGLLVVEVTAS